MFTISVAEVAAILNAELNNVCLKTETRNLIGNAITFQFDVIILGDVFYDDEIANIVIPWLEVLSAKRKTVIFLNFKLYK